MKRNIFKSSAVITAILIVILSLVFFVGCVKKEKATEIRIGVIAPLTGDAAVYGSALKKGLDLAEEEINRTGGIKGKRIFLIYEDSQADPKSAISAFNKLTSVMSHM